MTKDISPHGPKIKTRRRKSGHDTISAHDCSCAFAYFRAETLVT